MIIEHNLRPDMTFVQGLLIKAFGPFKRTKNTIRFSALRKRGRAITEFLIWSCSSSLPIG